MQFKHIIGQKSIIHRLIQSVYDARVSHAQLFLGPEGSGKLPLAIAYAQYINCENRQPEDSCGVCRSCRQFEKLVHPDLHFIYPVSTTRDVKEKPSSKQFIKPWRELMLDNHGYISLSDWYEKIGIENKQGIINAEDCNDIIKTLSYKSYESEYKVMIIWMVEKLFHSAAPKILKILEEPPEKTLFILISENQDQIINTILSRTQLLRIPKIETEILFTTLKSKYALPDSEIRKTVQLANGNFRNAIRFIEEKESENEFFNLFRYWMRACYGGIEKNNDSADGINFTSKKQDFISFVSFISKSGRETQKSFLAYSLLMIRNCLLYNTNNAILPYLDAEESDFVAKFSQFIHHKNVEQITGEINKAIYHIERNANPSILFTDLSFTCSRLIKSN